jgi:uncharacterized membrane protein
MAPLTVQFTDLSTNSPTSWDWNFGDGTHATIQNPSHTYTSPGTYTVILTATNAGGSDVETKVGYITVTGTGMPTISLQYTKITQPENARAQIWLRRTGSTAGESTVTITCTGGTAQNGVDYYAVNGLVRFAPGESRKAVWINLIDNKNVDGDRTFTVTISNPTDAYLGSRTTAVCTIKNNDLLGV